MTTVTLVSCHAAVIIMCYTSVQAVHKLGYDVHFLACKPLGHYWFETLNFVRKDTIRVPMLLTISQSTAQSL